MKSTPQLDHQCEQFENGLDTMVGERKGEERFKILTKAKYDEILRGAWKAGAKSASGGKRTRIAGVG
ncbi:MAG: hypothetical protein SGPRY_005636, partial [Prymnesium sp.]